MKLPANVVVGACSHTGKVRTNNEDDYLLGALDGGPFLAAIADGMGGLAGGAEASRTALRAAAAVVLDGGSQVPIAQRVSDGFAAAAQRVFDASRAVPALRDMGTTLTLVCLADRELVVGHVGDTRLCRVRQGKCEQLTEDHAVREPDNLLTRCIGAGQAAVQPDHAVLATAAGDRFVLVTDGVWSVVPAARFAQLVARGEPQVVAERLVAEALAHGGPDNATAVVIDIGAGGGRAPHVVALPREEPGDRASWPRPEPLRGPLWPWALWAVGVALLVHAGLVVSGFERGLLAFAP